MKNDKILIPTIFGLVLILHIGFISLIWKQQQPQIASTESIQFIDIGMLGGNSGQPKTSASTAPQESVDTKPKKEVKPIAKPKPQIKEKVAIKPVVKKNEAADLSIPKDTPKPTKKPEPKPIKENIKPTVDADTSKASPTPPKTSPTPHKEGSSPANDGSGNDKTSTKGASNSKGNGTNQGVKATGDGHGGAGNNTPGSSAGNPNKATGTIPRPPYPPISREEGEEGKVILKILVSPNGSISKVKVAKSSGFPRLDKAAKKAAQNGNFKPNGWTEYTVPVEFILH